MLYNLFIFLEDILIFVNEKNIVIFLLKVFFLKNIFFYI